MMSPLEKKPDYLVCTCMCMMYSDIVKAIHNGATTYEALQNELGVGTGCSSCVCEVKEILHEELATKKS